MQGTDSLTRSDDPEPIPGTGSESGSEQDPVQTVIYTDSESILQELQRLNSNLEYWFQSPDLYPVSVFNGITINTMFSLFFAAFMGGFCLVSLARIIGIVIRKIQILFSKI